MKTNRVKTETAEYPVFIGSGIIKKLPYELKKAGIAGKVLVVSSPRVFSRHGRLLLGVLDSSGIKDVAVHLFPDDEKNKTWPTCEKIIKKLFNFESVSMIKPSVVAFGGGVVGDVAGFAAGIYKRGIPLINVPTTLLSMVDSGIGGKTGVDFPVAGRTVKNMLGTFYQPCIVFSDTDFLKTLPAAEIKNGLAEIIKYGIIKDRRLFEFLENNVYGIVSLKTAPISFAIERSCAIKAYIVGRDERETKGLRYLLNLGHTIGHALESASDFKYSHGNAISIGISCAAEISAWMNLMDISGVKRIERLLSSYGLPTAYSGITPGDVMRVLRYDKKFGQGKNRFVLPVSIGRAVVAENVRWGLVKKTLTLHRLKMYNHKP